MNKLVVIIGAGSGIGKALAHELSRQGHPSLLLARRKDAMEDFRLENRLCDACDVSNKNEVVRAIHNAESIYGPTNLVINCAGLMLLGGAHNQDIEEWYQMLDTNIKGVLITTYCVLDDMRRRNEGALINIGSISGRKTFPNHAIYCASKFAVHALTEAIREEVAQSNVRMTTIAPGVAEALLLSHTTNEEIKDSYQAWKETIDGGLSPQAVVDCVLFSYKMPQEVCVREIVIAKTKQLG